MKQGNIGAQFVRYVSQNILGTVGVSCYILADTFFISVAAGADGITVLNLALPIYGLIFAIGSLIGVGSATRFSICTAKQEADADMYFFNAFFWICMVSVPFLLAGLFFPQQVLMWMGADAKITSLGVSYIRIVLCFTPFFMLNYLFQSFVRNDHAPTKAMLATLSGSIINIVLDYIFMFPMGLGLKGAALATSVAPIFGITICSTHFMSRDCHLKFLIKPPSIRRLVYSCQLGIAAFVGEMSQAVTTMVFNFLLLAVAGNIGVAAYGVVANFALVAVAVFNGIAQGAQPLVSRCYGTGKSRDKKKLFYMSVTTAICIACLLIGAVYCFTDSMIAFFNSEGSDLLASYAFEGLRLYFPGYLFAGFNIVVTGFFGATDRPREAFIASILRGFAAIIVFACVLSACLGIRGIWMSFGAAELLTAIVIFHLLRKERKIE